MSKICRLAVLCASMVVLAGPAFAQAQPIRVGGLTCDAAPRVGLLVGSRQNLRCVFSVECNGAAIPLHWHDKPDRPRCLTGGGRLFWGVFAPNLHVGYGVLRGTYVGASGNASFGLGLGANVLVGGSHRTISLQPLSVEGQIGVNLALGVARLTLR